VKTAHLSPAPVGADFVDRLVRKRAEGGVSVAPAPTPSPRPRRRMRARGCVARATRRRTRGLVHDGEEKRRKRRRGCAAVGVPMTARIKIALVVGEMSRRRWPL
jgi:hypothetical protein